MNAIVGFCHFCEAHGPRPLFCTFTTDNEAHATEPSKYPLQCNGCTSLGTDTVLISKDDDGTIFCSRESVPNADVNSFLRQAAVRSITCEVNWSKDGGIVYFSESQGHVLSFMFKLQDTRARGLKRWFSIVVLMKDQMMLLSLTQLLTEHMQKISAELQHLAENVYNEEQKICSQRALRLKTGRNDFGPSRSLLQLTGDVDVFKRLHSHFTWMLKAGAHNYSEILYTSQDLLHKLKSNSIKNTIFEQNACNLHKSNECISIRGLENLVSNHVFRALMYCTLVGIQTQLKCTNTDPSIISTGLARLLPFTASNSEQNSKNICVLEETENSNFTFTWLGSIPNKVPTIMARIEKAMANNKLNDVVLHQLIKTLQIEWLGIVRSVKSAIAASGPKASSVTNLKTVLGITQADESLVNYWLPKISL